MRCLGWRFHWGSGEWSNLYPCHERWRPGWANLNWVQVWEDE